MTDQDPRPDFAAVGRSMSALGEAMTAAFVPAFRAAAEAMTELMEAFAVALRPLVAETGASLARVLELVSGLAEWQHDDLARSYVVRFQGVAASDVRSVSGRTVRLWNHRRIELDPGFEPWAYEQVSDSVRRVLEVDAAFGAPTPIFGMIVPASALPPVRFARLRGWLR